MSAAEIVCLSLMLVAVIGGALADWAYAREIEKDRAHLLAAMTVPRAR